MILCFSRHQYAEMVADQKISTWLACHRRALSSSTGRLPRRSSTRVEETIMNPMPELIPLLYMSQRKNKSNPRFDLSDFIGSKPPHLLC